MSTAFDCAPPTRIALLDADGSALIRWTLQDPDREGRTLRWRPEGVARQLGGGTRWRRAWKHQGFRIELGLRWSAGLTSSRETWSSSGWSPAQELPTAAAHCEILAWAAEGQVEVEPFAGTAMPKFKAAASEKGPSMQDTRGIIHKDLELVLPSLELKNSVLFEQAAHRGGWGLGPWGLMPWGH